MRQNPGSKRERRPASLRARALQLLARREHTRVELQRKLAPHAGKCGELETLLDELTQSGFLSEARAAEHFVHARRTRFGTARIRRELLAKGVSEDAIAAALPALKQGDLETARSIWRRKFGAPPANAGERARQVRFLQGRGFDLDTIMKVIRLAETHNEDR